MDLGKLTDRQLLDLYCDLMAQLRDRGVVRSSNNPVADYAETLIAKALSAKLENNSKAGYDAVDANGARYQIKGRRLTPQNKSTQLSSMRRLETEPFDYLAAVMFDSRFNVEYAALIPRSVVSALCRYVPHTNSHAFHFRKSVLDAEGVRDISAEVRSAALS